METDVPLFIRIESVAKHSPANATPSNQSMRFKNIIEAREFVVKQRNNHQKNSAWFKFYNEDDDCIFNSKLIKT